MAEAPSPKAIGTTRRLYEHIESGRMVSVKKYPHGAYVVVLDHDIIGTGPELCDALDVVDKRLADGGDPKPVPGNDARGVIPLHRR